MENILTEKFTKHREPLLRNLWIRNSTIIQIVRKLSKSIFRKSILGYSENNKPIYSIGVGTGTTKILLWSQMHGDESTATKSIFDIFNYIEKEFDSKEIKQLLASCTLLFVPMLNPDGALAYTRENADGIDLNRDAQTRKSIGAKLLYKLLEEFQPNYAFNLHDQTSYYSVEGTNKPATISFLSPAADSTQKITESRKEAMRVIATMNKALQKVIPNQIGRYKDTFNENCFGDTFQMNEIPTILIESGYYTGDELREKTRQFHFIALMTGLFAIAQNKFENDSKYFDIPMNVKNYYDVRFNNIKYNEEITDIAIRYSYKVLENKFVKIIDTQDIITGEHLKDKLFHITLDMTGKFFDEVEQVIYL